MISNRNLILSATLLSCLTLQACGVGEASVAENKETQELMPVPVEVAYPERADIFATYEATSTIASDDDAPALARVPGEVVSILVEEGDRVVAGQVLATLDGERLRLEMLAAKANLDQTRGEYERYQDLHARGLVSASMYEGLKYDLDALEAVYDLASLNYDYSSIRAPIDGFVSARDIKLGQNLEMNQVAFRITDTSELVAYLQIPQTELSKFNAGHAAALFVDSMPGQEFSSRIIRISPTIDTRNGTFRATALIDNSHGNLAPGMFARFTISYEMHENALVIPAAAVIEEDEQLLVYVVEEGTVSRKPVKTGITFNGDVEVLQGLQGDEEIVVVGHSSLRDGSKVLAQGTDSNSYTG